MKDLNEVKRYLERRNSQRHKEPLPFKIEEILPLLENHIKNTDTFIRRLALDIMFLLESKDCKNLLEQSLKDNYPYHRTLAFQTLVKIYEPAYFPILDAAINREEEETKTRWDMLYHLHVLNDKAFLPTLSKWILKAEPSNAYTIQRIIENFNYPELIPVVLKYAELPSHDANSKNAIVKTLGILQAKEGLGFILQHAGHQFAPNVFSDATCLVALVEMNVPELYLEKISTYADRQLQLLIEALGILKFLPSKEILIKKLHQTPDINIRISLAKALKNLGYTPDNEKDRIFFELVHENWEIPEKNSEIANEILAQITLSNTNLLANRAMLALGKNRSKIGVQSLLQQIKSKDNQRRILAIENLGEIGDDSAIPALVEYLQSDSYNEPYFDYGREKAVRALGKIGNMAVVPFLLDLLKNNPSISGKGDCLSFNSKALVQVLTNFYAEEAIPILVEYLLHPNSILREESIHSLKIFNWQPDHLQNQIRWLAATKNWESIPRLGFIAVKPLMRIAENKNIFGHTDLMLALAKIGDQQALDFVLNWLFQPRYCIHHQADIDNLQPYFQPLFGDLTIPILYAATFIDSVVTEDGRSTYYSYFLHTAIQATQLLKNSTNPLSKKVLPYILQKKSVSLPEAEHEEYGSSYTNFDFKEQIDNS